MYIIGPDFQTMPFLDSRLCGNDVVVPKDAVMPSILCVKTPDALEAPAGTLAHEKMPEPSGSF